MKVPNIAKKGGPKAVALTANDNKLLAYLQGTLKSGDAKAITGSMLAAGSDLPLGSVGVSLKKIIASGAVNRVGRGTYQIGAIAAVLASEPVLKNAPTKKVKPSEVKKVRAVNTVKAEVPAAKEVKANSVKVFKAAPAKKAKAPAAKKLKLVAGSAATKVGVTAPTIEAEAPL